MGEKSRIEYTAINAVVSVISKVSVILIGFVVRIVFVRMLDEAYVGINGFFTDIIGVLSLTDLGMEYAIHFALYRPVAEGDIKKQQALLRVLRWFYWLSAACVGGLGLALIPFMDVLMKNSPSIDHLILIYLLYLGNSVISYLFAYKRILISAHQQNYIILLYQTGALLLQDVVQIIVLVSTKNFIIFSMVYCICTMLGNVCISKRADKMYPEVFVPNREKLSAEENKGLMRNVRAMMMHKLGGVMVNNTDNLIISSFVGIISVGLYSNYFLITASVRQVLDQVFSGITASVGNLNVKEETGVVESVFKNTLFIGQWLYGVAAICLYELLNPFVELCFGKNYLFTSDIVLVLCAVFFLTGLGRPSLTFRDSLGLFWFDRYEALAEAVLNVVTSIILVQKFGVFGVFAGTLISMLLTTVWVEPFVLYHHGFKKSMKSFWLRLLVYIAVMAAVWFVTDLICRSVAGSPIWMLVLRGLVCAVVPNAILLLVYLKTEELQTAKWLVKTILQKYVK